MIWTTQPRFKVGPLAAISRGTGPLVLLIHGVGLRAEAWGAQMDALAETHRVVAVDMPGHGQSAALAGTPRLADFTDAIATALDAPAVVIGHSFGAIIALDMAVRHQNLVTGVGALNAIYRRDIAAKHAVKARADALDGVTMADPGATLKRWFGGDASPQQDACRDWLCAVNPAGYRAAYRVFAHEDGPREQELRDLHCPVLFLTGGRELNSTPDMSRQMAALVNCGQAKVVADAAHMLPMTHGAQVNAILAEFLKAQTS